ncbi:hypothetical protein KI688_004355 [Linnemannia hyalina]|uniref:Adenylate kinase isoenzyme 6 homolog n=1 Tax=Linnemannia hyalina TaxID=64524 RepID=A0A9P7XLW3_9FUNG|nr:hypothetical protein KI688_004355 [Linnemannia hyalina]
MDSDSDYEAEIPHFPRDLPNILITGTPGTGKTTTSEMAAEATGLTHINVGDLVKAKSLHEGLDTEYDSYILDEDKLVDEMEEMMRPGGKIVDFHTCEIFPERWFDLVIVLRTDNGVLYPRLESRGYNAKKINENMECEIMQVVLEEARESYEEQIVIELESNSIEQMEENVKDEQGRRRFHGAFTGGFSAGYYNTVGSAEGSPEDFMDEEDKQMLSDATRITATDDFGASGSAQRELARKRAAAMNMQASGSVLGALSDAMIDDLIIPTSESIGARLLKRMGWKPGQGIGPRVSRRQRNPKADPLSDDDAPTNVSFAPIDSAIIVFANKSNRFGLGFNPHKDAPEFDVSAHAQSGSRYLSGADSGVTGSRLGFGLLSDSEGDEDESGLFGTGSNSRRRVEMEMDLDTAVSLDKRQKSSYGSVPTSNSRSASILVYCSDGRPPLAGFILVATKALDPKWYTAPIVPSDFTPRHIFTSDGKTTSSTKQHGQSKLTADDRALVLGETPIDAPRRSVFEYMSSENKNRLDGALGFVLDVHGEKHLRKDHWEVPTIEKSAAEAALQGFIPFSDDISKQRRYKQYLNVQAGLSAEKIEMVEGFSGEDMNKELNEFVQAARIFKPMSTSMSSRFATASKIIEFQQPSPGLRTGAEIQASLAGKPSAENRLIERMEVPKSQAAKAAEMGMFGPLTRSMADFYPNKLLCKRFNVPDPHPEHKDVGPDTAKDLLDKATMDSMLAEGSSARFSLSKEASSTTGLTADNTVPEVELEQAELLTQVPQERPPMDIFKAIFDDSDSSSDSDVGMDADDAGVNTTAPGQPVNPVSEASAMDQDKADVAVVTQRMGNELEGDLAMPLRHVFTKRTSRPTRSPSPRAGSPNQAAKTGLRRFDDRARDVESEVESDDAQIGPRLDLSERRATTESAGRALSRKPRSSGTDTRHHPNTYQEIGPGHSTLTSRSNNRDSSEEFIGPPVAPTSAVEPTFSAAEESGRSGQGRKEADDRDHEARRESRSSKQHESLVSRKDESERTRSRKSRSERSSSSHRRSLSIEHNSSKSRRRAEVVGNHSTASSDSDDHAHPTESRSDGPLSARKSGKKTRATDDRVGDREDANSHSNRARKDRSSTRRHKEHRSRPSDRDRELGHGRSSSSHRHKHSRAVREPSRRDDRDRDPTQERSKDRHAKMHEDEDDSDSLWVEKEVTSTLVEESEAPGSVDSTQAAVSSRSRPRAAAFF